MKRLRMFRKFLIVLSSIFIASIAFCPVSGGTAVSMEISGNPSMSSPDGEPFFEGGTYMGTVPSPDEFLGFPLGSKPVDHEETLSYLNHLAELSPRVQFQQYGESHEGRELFYGVISSESNISQIDKIKASVGRLADPRKLSGEKEAGSLIENTPAICWLGYSIHGDELSSTDCALQVAYQLAAGTDTLTDKLLRDLIVIIDPLRNPDGRDRFVAQLQQLSGTVPNPDHQSLQHRGFWPWGRGNHYLFDLNRDCFALVHPESRARVRAILEWHPQLQVDSHEMGPLDTYLFSPPREPFNPNITERQKKWWGIFARDQARAFNTYGWSYYTREWSEEWYPGYANSWALYTGAIGILYEQAGVDGSLVKQRDGSILTYRESVHHHFVSSMANLTTAANNRKELLSDFYEEKLRSTHTLPPNTPGAFLFVPGNNPERTADFVDRLLLQDIEVYAATEDFKVKKCRNYWGQSFPEKRFPEGTFIIHLNQPMRPLIMAILEFDPRMTKSFLIKERRRLEKKGKTSVYDATAWSFPIAYDIEAYSTENRVKVNAEPVIRPERSRGGITQKDPQYGWLIDSERDGCVKALIRLFQEGCTVRAAVEPLKSSGIPFATGSLLLRRRENSDLTSETLDRIASETGAAVHGVNTALSDEGPDLGGGRFRLLEQPRIGVFAGSHLSTTSYGALWHLLDGEYGFRFSSLDIGSLNRMNLDTYNVLVLPHAWGDIDAFQEVMSDRGLSKLKSWIEAGGTLITIGSASAFAADTSVGLSKVRLRRQILNRIDDFTEAVAREREAERAVVDSIALWEGKEEKEESQAEEKKSKKSVKSGEEDEYQRRFMPRGCILRADLDAEHWLTAGMKAKVPVFLYTTYALMSKGPVETAARLAQPDSLRVSGLLWPEARDRWASTAYLTREKLGKGQIILFAGFPAFRGYFRGSMRLLMNALLLGPGFGTSRPMPW
ncbi:MAG: hypothetical protein JSV84_05065 [Gemmatimonadota bacterium]|nr:MAG: hypothetical protein JSV84_05065 [Gemmatimonadota bacterium]